MPTFRKPKAHNASATLLLMGGLSIAMMLGISVLSTTAQIHIADSLGDLTGVPVDYEQRTVLAQLSAAVFGNNTFGFYAVQGFTTAILVLAANTAFNGFPILASILAADRFMPKQLKRRGDRLVFSNGVVILAAGVEAGALLPPLGRAAPVDGFEQIVELVVGEGRVAAAAVGWLEIRPGLPVAAQLVVGGALFQVLEHRVGFAEGLEAQLGVGLLAHVRVVLARQPPVGSLDLGIAGGGLDAQRRVVILEFHPDTLSERVGPAALRRRGRYGFGCRRGAILAGHGAADVRAARAYAVPPALATWLRGNPKVRCILLTDLPDDAGQIPELGNRNARIRTEGTDNLLAAEANRPRDVGRGGKQPEDRERGDRFSGAGFTDDGRDLALAHLQRNTCHGFPCGPGEADPQLLNA